MTTTKHLVDYLNLIAEYEGLPSSVSFAGRKHKEGLSLVLVNGSEYIVNTSFAMANAQRLPSRCSLEQMVEALCVSHPSVKQQSKER